MLTPDGVGLLICCTRYPKTSDTNKVLSALFLCTYVKDKLISPPQTLWNLTHFSSGL